MAGYSKTSLAKKLGLKSGMRAVVWGAPADYDTLLHPQPEAVFWQNSIENEPDFVHVFVDQRAALEMHLSKLREHIASDGMIWVSWPKKASKVPTDVTEDTIRDICLPLGLVDVKVCAVDETWSGLKLMIRKELR